MASCVSDLRALAQEVGVVMFPRTIPASGSGRGAKFLSRYNEEHSSDELRFTNRTARVRIDQHSHLRAIKGVTGSQLATDFRCEPIAQSDRFHDLLSAKYSMTAEYGS